jgi:hypothetical protein
MTANSLDTIKPMPGESVDAFWVRALNAVFADAFVEEQTEAGVRKRIARGDFRYAVRLMKAWFERKPEDIEVLRSLKAYLIERRAEVRATRAGYARTYRRKKRERRAAEDVRACVVCGASLAGRRGDAETCSVKCRVTLHRKKATLT